MAQVVKWQGIGVKVPDGWEELPPTAVAEYVVRHNPGSVDWALAFVLEMVGPITGEDEIPTVLSSEQVATIASVGKTATTEAERILVGLAKQKRHDYKGDGGSCEVCGEPADDEIHYGAEEESVAPDTLATTIVEGGQWVADPLALEQTMTRDGRIFDEGALYWNKTGEMSLMAQTTVPEGGGHAGAFLAGAMPGSGIQREGNVLTARGIFNTDEDGQRAEEYVRNRSLTGISIDIAPQEWQIELAPEDGGGILLFTADELTEDEESDDGPVVIEKSVDDMTIRFKKAEIIGATLVATPAFGETQVSLAASAQGYPIPTKVTVQGYVRMRDESLAASGWTPHSIGDLSQLVETVDRATAAGFIDTAKGKQIIEAAMGSLIA